ncbi:MAG: endolytic transglycosylase MltG, partial [Thermoleophilia bacterium]|nr:endolytic transglycosylase MltG [Thermoleophilia bacterium]
LFPATYDLTSGMTAKRLVAQQLRAFKSNFRSVNMSYAHSKNLNVFDVVTIASLVEREVQLPRERRLVAAVIYNRLKRGIALGIDATTRFETNNWTEPLTAAQLTKNTPYNTRTRRGLPPGPIGSPGLDSLRAAAQPAKVGYVYYVANPCKHGSHAFSSTYAQFQHDVQRYRLARDAAGGKQPGGC